MNSSGLYRELDLLNIMIALNLNNNYGGIENVLFKDGYRIISIDREVDTDIGTVAFDIFLFNKNKNKSIGMELKGGNASNLTPSQLEKYSSITPYNYVRLTAADYDSLDDHQTHILLGINASRKNKVLEYLKEKNFHFPILGVDREEGFLKPIPNENQDFPSKDELENLTYEEDDILSFIFFDKESKEHEIATRVGNCILQYLTKGIDTFSDNEIAKEAYTAIPNLINTMGTKLKTIRKPVIKILTELSQNHLKEILEYNSSEKSWKLKSLEETDYTLRKASSAIQNYLLEKSDDEQLTLF